MSVEEQLDRQAAKRIGQVFMELDAASNELRDTRKLWNERVAASMASFRGAVERDDDGTPEAAREKLQAVVEAYQDLQEAEAGRKQELHVLKARVEELRKKMRLQIEGAKQLGLFDDVKEEADGNGAEERDAAE